MTPEAEEIGVAASLAVVEDHEKRFTSAHPPEKFWKLWKRSAWADLLFIYHPWQRYCTPVVALALGAGTILFLHITLHRWVPSDYNFSRPMCLFSLQPGSASCSAQDAVLCLLIMFLMLFLPFMAFFEIRIGHLQVRSGGQIRELLADAQQLQQAQRTLLKASQQDAPPADIKLQILKRSLASSSQLLYNLTLRVEAVALAKTGADIKGLAVAAAAISITGALANVRVKTLPGAMALIKLRSVAFTSRAPRTPVRQFWRPSAWADAWYGYDPGKRSYQLPDMPLYKRLMLNPSLISIAKLCMVNLAAAKHALGGRLFWAITAGSVALISWRIKYLAVRFLNRNLIPGHYTYQQGTVKNMPLLLEHLRELQAAKGVLDTHLQNIEHQSAAAAQDYGISSLSVLHSVQSHAIITANLRSRLEDACKKFTGQRLSDPDRAEALMITEYLNGRVVTFMGGP